MFKKFADLIIGSHKIVVFTGAGISTESGIPDFRSPGGVWERYQPVYFDEFVKSHDARKRYWLMKKELFKDIDNAKPNKAHKAIVQLEGMGKLYSLITQNIDGLHQDAGSSPEKIIEIHGTNREVICLECGKLYSPKNIYERLQNGQDVPQCDDCDGFLKPNTVSFGQSLPVEKLALAEKYSSECDLFIVIGSSLVVQPASFFPVYAKQGKAKLVIVNNTETPHDSIADMVIRERAGKVLSETMRTVLGK
ncbi:MAG: SIR2 family NAD-dependent protein deacylase [Candidatus Anammoxibacter sp.]